MRTRDFNISKELRPYIRFVLTRRKIPHRFFREGDKFKVSVPLSGQKFHEIVQRARCEQLSKETGVFHITYKESCDGNQVAVLLKEFGQGAFVVMGSERTKG